MRERKELTVKYKGETVGRLALSAAGKVAFAYDKSWLAEGFSISPFSLPLAGEVFVPAKYDFDGLFGVFADSLPDAWGRLVLDRMLKKNGINPAGINALDRLAIVGTSGMGALEYVPEYKLTETGSRLTIEELAEESRMIFESRESDRIDELFSECGSSGGARPKALVKIDGEDWIVKFNYSLDPEDAGETEYAYSVAAKECGIDMPETRIIDTGKGRGYFAVRRFDRPKTHMISAAALLEIDFERSTADYGDLFKMTDMLTNGNRNDLKEMYRRMCFNVFAENQDDHLKNFAFLYDDCLGIWRLSPAFDLTHAVTGYGEHTTTVNGKGKNITEADIIAVGTKAGLSKEFCCAAGATVKDICARMTAGL